MTKRKLRAAPWGNRIVRTGEAAAGTFLANEENWRIHPLVQQEVLGGILQTIGFVQHVIVNLRSDPSWGRNRNVETLVDGHLRVSLALTRGEDTLVPVTYVDLTQEEERLVLATLDPIGQLAATDKELLASIRSELPEDFAALTAAVHDEIAGSKRTVTFETKNKCRVVVDCKDDRQQEALLQKLIGEGYTCRAD